MRVLGAVLAGGASRRFGSDKAVTVIDGRPMLTRVADALAAQCKAVVVAGRDWPGFSRVDDLPRAGLGPLGGLAGALAFAQASGFEAVLTSGCDLPALPANLVARLAPADAVLAGQPTIGLWRADHAAALTDYLRDTDDRSIRAWAALCGARKVDAGEVIANINTPDDLATFSRPPAGPRSSR